MSVLGIFGAGGLGIEILEMARIVNEIEKRWDEFVFVNNGDECEPIDNVLVMGLEEAITKYGEIEAVIAVGEPTLRAKIAKQIADNNFLQPNIIYPGVHIPRSVKLGRGVCIFPGVYVSTNVSIGDNVLISPNAVVGHDNIIENNVVISSTAVLAGMVHVKENAYIGPGSIIKESLTIGNHSVAAIGSVIFKDIADGDLAIGNPARISKRSDERIFKG